MGRSQAKQQMLFTELRKVKKAWQSQVTLADILELINYAFRNVKENHSDIYLEAFKDNITSIFMNDLHLCRNELRDNINRIFMENKYANPYREALKESIESIFSNYNDLLYIEKTLRNISATQSIPALTIRIHTVKN